MTLGLPRLHLRLTDSTNERARALAKHGAPHGTLVTAEAQTAGRGRQGRGWLAPPGRALLCSLVLRDPPRLLPLAAGVATAEVCGPTARLKWPNDVLIEERKVSGILVEGRVQEGWVVLGIGINVALRSEDLPPELRDRAAGLGASPDQIEPTLAALLAGLKRWLGASTVELLEAWRRRDALRGREVRWTGGSGRAAGIDDHGRLVVEAPGGEVVLEAGEVHLSSA